MRTKRRSFIKQAAAIAATTIVSATAADWPRFLGPQGSGTSPERGLACSWPADGPRVLWKRALAPGYGGAAVRDGCVFILDRPQGAGDVLLCLDLYTGDELWRCPHGGAGTLSFDGTRSTPSVGPEHVYTIGPYGHVACIDRKTRALEWSVYLKTRFNVFLLPKWGVAQSPVLYNDKLITVRHDRRANLVALDRRTGETVWKSPGIEDTRLSFVTPYLTRFAGVDQVIMLSRPYGGSRKEPPVLVTSIDPDTGKILWRTIAPGTCNIPIPQPVRIGTNGLFLAGGYRFGAHGLRVVREDPKWKVEPTFRIDDCTPHVQTPVFYKNHLYVQSFDSFHNKTNGGLSCYDAAGNLKWRTGPSVDFDNGNVVVADDLMFVMNGRKGTLSLVSATSEACRVLSETRVFPEAPDEGKKGGIWAPMALSGGKLLARNSSQLVCLDVSAPDRGARGDTLGAFHNAHPPTKWVRSRNMKWSVRLPGAAQAAATVCRDRVYVASSRRSIVCFRVEDGARVWECAAAPESGDGEPGRAEPVSPASTPVVANDAVFAAFGDGTVLCCSLSGERRWSTALHEPAAAPAAPHLTAMGKRLICSSGGLRALDAQTGDECWSVRGNASVSAPCARATVPGVGTVLITAAGRAILEADGSVLAADLPTCAARSAPVARDDVVFIPVHDADKAGLRSVRLSAASSGLSSEPLWECLLPQPQRWATAPALASGRIHMLTASGTLIAIDAVSGRLYKQTRLATRAGGPLPATGQSDLVVVGGRVYASNLGADNRTVILDPSMDYETVWEYAVAGGPARYTFEDRSHYMLTTQHLSRVAGLSLPAHRPRDLHIKSVQAVPAKPRDPRVPYAGLSGGEWAYAGPFASRDLNTDFLADGGGRARAWLARGTKLLHGDTTTNVEAVEPGTHTWSHPKFTAGLDAVDLTSIAGRDGNATVLLFTVVTNTTLCYARFHLLTPGGETWHPVERLEAAAWLAGARLSEADIVRLEPGHYPLLVQAGTGPCPDGKIWFAPRLEKLPDAFAATVARHADDVRAWEEYEKQVGEGVYVFDAAALEKK